MASITVYFKPVPPGGTPYFHEFLVYTPDDSSGPQIARGGPQLDQGPSLDAWAPSVGNGGPLPFGYIVTYTGAYKQGAPDYPPGTYQSQVLISGPQVQIAPMWNKIVSFVNNINTEHFLYGLVGPNSNSVVHAALQSAGLPLPSGDSLNGPFPAPGADIPLRITSSIAPVVANLSTRTEQTISNIVAEVDDAVENGAADARSTFQSAFGLAIGADAALTSYVMGDVATDGISATNNANGTITVTQDESSTGNDPGSYVATANMLTGDILDESFIDNTTGSDIQLLPDASSADDTADIALVGTVDTAVIENPDSYIGTISNFGAFDSIDLADIGTATGATLGINNVLTVYGGTGGPLTLHLDLTQDYGGHSFLITPDGAGGTDIVAESDTQPIAFTGSDEELLVVNPGSLTGIISDFLPGDTIDLTGIGNVSGVTLGANNVLTVLESGGGTVTVNLDPTQDYSDVGFAIGSDGISGTDVSPIVFKTIDDPNGTGTGPRGINNAGQIVGDFSDASGVLHAFLDTGGSFTTIDDPNGTDTSLGFESYVVGINNAGQIVGQYADANGRHSFVDTSGSFTTVDDPNSIGDTEAFGINDSGQLVGLYSPGSGEHGFLDTGGSFTTVDDPNGIGETAANGINDAGQIVGDFYDANDIGHGFLDTGGNYTTIDDPNAIGLTEPIGINAAGRIVGYYLDASDGLHGFVDTGGSFTTIEGPNATNGTVVYGINDAGQIVGVYYDASYVGHAFVADIGTPSVVCFVDGTRIATPLGESSVERLAVGDAVLTHCGEARRIVWIGEGRVLATPCRRTAATPVIVRKNAIAENVPHSDLRITKAHSLYINGVLIPAEFLVNHRSILWDDHAQEVTIYHIELERHDVLLANGAPAESYRDDGNRWLFRNANSGWGLPPQEPCAPVLTGGPVVDAVWQGLLERAGPRLGIPTTDDPDLHLLSDGRRVDAASRSSALYVFHFASRPASLRIVSRTGTPQELGLARDPRPLGVALRQIMVTQGVRVQTIEANDPSLKQGFHGFEADNDIRWTNGDATIPERLFNGLNGNFELALRLGGTTSYVDEGNMQRVA